MEQVQTTAAETDSVEVFENDIEFLFNEYCEKYGIENMRKEKQTVFDGAMRYIYRHYFEGTDKLKVKSYYLVNNSINNMLTNFNAYDVDILYKLYIYIQELANAYDKVASVAAFKKLTGISRQAISAWHNKSSNSGMDKAKKTFIEFLYENGEDELKEFNLRNPLGTQEQLNVDYGRREVKTTLRIDGSASNTMSFDEIKNQLQQISTAEGIKAIESGES